MMKGMSNRGAPVGGDSGDESGESDAAGTATTNGILSTTAGVGCTSINHPLAGWCDKTIDDGRHEVTLMIVTEL
jgi:hypothetical protein